MTLSKEMCDVDFDAGRSDALVLRVAGEVDMCTVEGVRGRWTELLSRWRTGQDLAVVDLTEVSFCGTAGLVALIQFQEEASDGQLALRLVISADDRTVLRPLQLTGLIDQFDVYPDLATALAGRSVA